ncbi:phasin family protein [Pseudogemmobacter sp. W21_MBD1_M6]|uniref:phasin family protein n=1 Tax=Pseudogemmobacter sp. W21_MBD1_M6 TaxID=3240271 RepID=UPI003F9BA6E5
MADQTKPNQTPKDPATAMTEAFAAIQKSGMMPMTWFGAAMAEKMAEINSECAQFIADRIKEDVQTQHRMLHCKDMDQIKTVQTEFLNKAIEQYTAETGKLVQLSQKMMDDLLNAKRT